MKESSGVVMVTKTVHRSYVGDNLLVISPCQSFPWSLHSSCKFKSSVILRELRLPGAKRGTLWLCQTATNCQEVGLV